MKIRLLFFFVIFSGALINNTQGQTNLNQTTISLEFDTSAIITKADSVAVFELKKHDAESGRYTGVPLDVVHYDKQINTDKDKNFVIVSYRFNKSKYYGQNNEQITIPNTDGYPYRFQVRINLKTKEMRCYKGR